MRVAIDLSTLEARILVNRLRATADHLDAEARHIRGSLGENLFSRAKDKKTPKERSRLQTRVGELAIESSTLRTISGRIAHAIDLLESERAHDPTESQ